MGGMGSLVAAGHNAHGGLAVANPVADQCQCSIAGDWAGCGFHIDESNRRFLPDESSEFTLIRKLE